MSHTMNIKTQLTDVEALKRACVRVGARELGLDTFKLYKTHSEGRGVQLAGWNYPIVIKADGTIDYDNYNGAWGDERRLHELEAAYSLEKAIYDAWALGYRTVEGTDKDGNLTLEIETGY